MPRGQHSVQYESIKTMFPCAMAASPDTGRALDPLQMGVKVKGRSQIIGHTIWDRAAATLKNITVDRVLQRFQQLISDCCTSCYWKVLAHLAPFADSTYCQPGRLIISRAPEGSAPITSGCGVSQGDACRALQLLLTTQYQLELVCLTHPDAAPVAYMDNTFL